MVAQTTMSLQGFHSRQKLEMFLVVTVGVIFLTAPRETLTIRIREPLHRNRPYSPLPLPALKATVVEDNDPSALHFEHEGVALSSDEVDGDGNVAVHDAPAIAGALSREPHAPRGVNTTPGASDSYSAASQSPASPALPIVLSRGRPGDGGAPHEQPVEDQQRGRRQKSRPISGHRYAQEPTLPSTTGPEHSENQRKAQQVKHHGVSLLSLTPNPAKQNSPPDPRGNQQQQAVKKKGQVPAKQPAPRTGNKLAGSLGTLRNVFTRVSRRGADTKPFKDCLPSSDPEHECECETGYYFNGSRCSSVSLTNACAPGTAFQRIKNTYECECPEGYIDDTVKEYAASSSSATAKGISADGHSSTRHRTVLLHRCTPDPCSGHRNCFPGQCTPVKGRRTSFSEPLKYKCTCPAYYESAISPDTNMEICRDVSQLGCGDLEAEACGPVELVEGCVLMHETVQCSCRSPAYLNAYTGKCTLEPICDFMPCGSSAAAAACTAGSTPGTWNCLCKEGFELFTDPGGRQRCIKIDNCAKNPCGPPDKVDKCISSAHGYTCRCKPGYTLKRGTASNVCQ